MRVLLIFAIVHCTSAGSLVTVQHYNQPAGITYDSSFIPIGLRAGPAVASAPIVTISNTGNQYPSGQYVSSASIGPVHYRKQPVYTPTPGAVGLLPPYASGNIAVVPQRQSQALTKNVNRNSQQVKQVFPARKHYSQSPTVPNAPQPSRYYAAPDIANNSQLKRVRLEKNRQSISAPAKIQADPCPYPENDEEGEEEAEVEVPIEPITPHVQSRKFEVRRPAIHQQFYDVEQKVIVRPAGSAVVELEHKTSQTENSGSDIDAGHDETDHYYSSPHHHTYHPQEPVYNHQIPVYSPQIPIYNHQVPVFTPQPQVPVYTPPTPGYIPPQTPDNHYAPDNSNHDDGGQGGYTGSTPCPPEDSEVFANDPSNDEGPVEFDGNDGLQHFENEGNNDADDSVVVEARSQQSQANDSNFVDIVYAQQPHQNGSTSNNTDNTVSVTPSPAYYTPEPNTDQIQRELSHRGDVSSPQNLRMQQPDQFYHELPQTHYVNRQQVQTKSRGTPSNKIAAQTNSEHLKNNEQRLIDLFSVKGGVTEVQYTPSGSLKSQGFENAQTQNFRARVISVTPAPDHEAIVKSSERSNIRRIVVSKPIETVEHVVLTDPVEERLARVRIQPQQQQPRQPKQQEVAQYQQQQQVEYVTPVPQSYAHLRAGIPVPQNQ